MFIPRTESLSEKQDFEENVKESVNSPYLYAYRVVDDDDDVVGWYVADCRIILS